MLSFIVSITKIIIYLNIPQWAKNTIFTLYILGHNPYQKYYQLLKKHHRSQSHNSLSFIYFFQIQKLRPLIKGWHYCQINYVYCQINVQLYKHTIQLLKVVICHGKENIALAIRLPLLYRYRYMYRFNALINSSIVAKLNSFIH